MDKERIRKATERIREKTKEIDEEVKDKKVKTRGDPVVKFM